MVTNSKIESILDPKSLELPNRPVVKRIQVQQDVDSLGDRAFRVWVILDDQTSDDERRWVMLAPIEERIKQKLSETGFEEWPYLTFRTEAEMQEINSGS
ncbi:MAG: hypothetical protein GC162_00100 [Planctomycetes bacterium]|nr:hypothetical protein [Planctomycetota bacterium]